MLQITGTSLFSFILSIVCIGIIFAACLHDIVARTIPNGLVLSLAIASIATAAIDGYLLGSLGAASGVFVLAALCWRRNWMGGGDVKLLGAAALGIPASSVFTLIAAVAIAGGLLAILYLAARPLISATASPRPDGLLARAARVERWRISRGGPLPYACAIAAGVLFVLVSGGPL